jgi:hypothetical protein
MLIGIIPLIIILIVPFIQMIWMGRGVKDRAKASAFTITVLAIVFGIVLSFIATGISMYGASITGIRCVTGSIGFMLIGCVISLVIVPIIGIIGGLFYHFKHKKVKVSL